MPALSSQLELEDSRAGLLINFTVARLKDGIVRDMRRLERSPLRLRVLRVSASKKNTLTIVDLYGRALVRMQETAENSPIRYRE